MSSSPEIQLVFSSGSLDVTSLTANYQYEYVVCFAFNVTSEEAAFTRKLANYLSTGEIRACCGQEWFDDHETIRTLRIKSKRFQEFVEANAKREDVAFVVTDKNEDVDFSGPAIILYNNGVPMDFDPPSQPGTPQPENICEDSIDLVWSAPGEGAAWVLSYNVLYCARGAAMDWSKKCTTNKEEKIHFERLTPSTEYCFKIEAVSLPGVSKESSVFTVETSCPAVLRPADSLVKQCSLIKQGPPSIYQLPLYRTMEDSKNKLIKYDIGSSNPSRLQPERVLMLVGATGAGKSTLINAMANFVLGVEWKDPFRFQVTSPLSQSRSQTKEIIAYSFHSTTLPYVLTILDTPGFGDTEGIENDRRIAKQIEHFFSKENIHSIDQLHGIGFVTVASSSRLTPTQRYIFDAILSIFGKDVVGNIFLMITFADSEDPPVLVVARDAGLPHEGIFKFNNSAIFARNNTNDDFKFMYWKMGVKGFSSFFNYFSVVPPQSLKMTSDVLKERQQLEVFILSLQSQVRFGLSQVSEIEEEQRVLQQHEAEVNANKDFKYTIKVPKHIRVPVKGVNTINCLTCNITCHNSCAYQQDADKSRCCAMRNGSCIVCPGKCHWKSHSNTPYLFKYFEEDQERTYEDLKKRYQIAQTKKNRCQSMIDTNEAILQKTQSQLFSVIEEIRLCTQHLDEIALRRNPLSDVDYLDILIESEKREHNTGWKDRVRQYENIRVKAEFLKKVPKVPVNERKKSWWSWWSHGDDQNTMTTAVGWTQSTPIHQNKMTMVTHGTPETAIRDDIEPLKQQCNLQ